MADSATVDDVISGMTPGQVVGFWVVLGVFTLAILQIIAPTD
jgi:hypothetical protein